MSFTPDEREEYNKMEATARSFYLDIKERDPSLISKNFLKISSALLPLRQACSGSQAEEKEDKTDKDNTLDIECPICLDHVEDARATPCKPVAHIFCKECIEGYFSGQNSVSCPSCRTEIRARDLRPVTKADVASRDDNNVTKKVKKNVVIENLLFQSKFERLLVELKRIRDTEPQAKSLVFSQFTSTLQWMKQELPKHGFQFRTLSGDMPMSKRAKALRDFQQDPPTTIFLLSLRSGAGMYLDT